MTRTRLALAALAAATACVACGPKHSSGPGGGKLPAAVSAYAALRWVPADATYAIASRKTSDVTAVTNELIDALGLIGEFTAAEARAELQQELGIDLLSADALADLGVDLDRGAAIWSRGLGPSVALPLADPERFAAELERRRGSAVVQVARAHDADVYTFRPDRDAAFHWAIAGDWFLAHVEIVEEREAEGAWFESAWSARGGLAGHADFAAALDEATRRLGADPPVVGLARVPAILEHPLIAAELVTEAAGCRPLFSPLGRVFVSAVAHEGDARGAIVAEIGAAADGVRGTLLPVPQGWVAARAKAPIQLDLGFDLHAMSAAFEPCTEESIVEDTDLKDLRGLRLFVHALDVDRMEGRGAGVVEVVNAAFLRDTVAETLDQIPGVRFMTKKRQVGALAVSQLDIPSFPSIAYAISGTTGLVTVDSSFEAMLGSGLAPGQGELLHVAVWPRAWPAETWNDVLREVIGRDESRALLIERLRRWSMGELTLTLEGRALVLTGHGSR